MFEIVCIAAKVFNDLLFTITCQSQQFSLRKLKEVFSFWNSDRINLQHALPSHRDQRTQVGHQRGRVFNRADRRRRQDLEQAHRLLHGCHCAGYTSGNNSLILTSCDFYLLSIY